ncbi:MAG: nucleotidyltransferase domain-containing protein [Nitrospinae bacterium]|nr:nucleotidyltransferase domain-containing protein [Nitrospinota bacterium]
MDALVERVTRKIAEAIHPDKIILFGSRARGTATEESDIDLVVIYSGQKTKREVELEIEDLFFPRDFSMDVIVMTPDHLERYKKIANTLAREVAETGVVCYG